LKQLEAGRKTEDVAREVGVSKHTIYAWKAKYGDRKTARDRVVSLRRDLVPVPEGAPLCERLKARKTKVNVGNAELYVEVEGHGTPIPPEVV
jgi:transposase-like protein